MRDNVLLEFGLFVGILGRRRVFIVGPDKPRIDVPSDLLGISLALYDAARAGSEDETELAAAVELAAGDIRAAIRHEWSASCAERDLRSVRVRDSERGQAILRLYKVAVRFRDAVLALQRESLSEALRGSTFDSIRKSSAERVRETAELFRMDARLSGVESQLEALRDATVAAIGEFPNPKDVISACSTTKESLIMALGAGIAAQVVLKEGTDSGLPGARQLVESESTRIAKVYADWWGKNYPRIDAATDAMRDALFQASTELATRVT